MKYNCFSESEVLLWGIHQPCLSVGTHACMPGRGTPACLTACSQDAPPPPPVPPPPAKRRGRARKIVASTRKLFDLSPFLRYPHHLSNSNPNGRLKNPVTSFKVHLGADRVRHKGSALVRSRYMQCSYCKWLTRVSPNTHSRYFAFYSQMHQARLLNPRGPKCLGQPDAVTVG